ncbi:hypothetical protein [Burkholderia sp. F1]|uniref:hypothetical protein n=1 Tax=Burkholderia sp. F1 TaxID=3366817 RepID=UPI003D72A651
MSSAKQKGSEPEEDRTHNGGLNHFANGNHSLTRPEYKCRHAQSSNASNALAPLSMHPVHSCRVGNLSWPDSVILNA